MNQNQDCHPTLEIMDDHEDQRVAGYGAMTRVIDALNFGPVLDKHDKRCHPPVHYNNMAKKFVKTNN